ncbi:MAG TPA: phosphotransferase [Ktedonobacterales bacterium]|nr:phosphotransferase [Ktedonobacterales bacterium]
MSSGEQWQVNWRALEHAWPTTGAWQSTPEPLAGGTNNLMYRVRAALGDYVLRLSGAQVDLRRLHFERDVMMQLARLGLPFALPIPLRTTEGELAARLPAAGQDGERWATLTALIAGEHPVRENHAQAAGAGEALGLLDAALARVRLAHIDDAIDWRSTGDLARCHPLVPDPGAAFSKLPLFPDETARLTADYDALMATLPALYASLPRQLSHEDYDPGNVLMVGAQVSGVLDWEFCALDLRVMDLVVALTWWPVRQFGSGEEWPILEALLRGFARRLALARAEIDAIPTIFRLRAYTSLIHRLGRYRQGLSPLEHVVWRAQAALARDAWLRENGERLVQLVDEALGKSREGLDQAIGGRVVLGEDPVT